MKKVLRYSLIAAFAVSTVNAQSLSDIFKTGKISGDISITSEKRDMKKETIPYYQDTAYAVASVGLEYKTGSYNGFSAALGLRAYKTLWEDDDSSRTFHGIGDASERIWEDGSSNGKTMLSNAYLAYDNKYIHIKAGRQMLRRTEFIGRNHDAVTAYFNPIKEAEVEFIWSKAMGRVNNIDLRPMEKTNTANKNAGVYKLGFTYKFTDALKTKVYAFNTPSDFSVYAGKVDFSRKDYGVMVHYAESDHDNGQNDSEMIEIKAYKDLLGVKTTLGYIKLGDNGWGDINKYGDTSNPYEEGDALYFEKEAETKFLMLSKRFNRLGLTAIYGITDYKKAGKDAKAKEFNLWANYKVTKEFSLACGFAKIDEDKSEAVRADLNQFNLKAVYRF